MKLLLIVQLPALLVKSFIDALCLVGLQELCGNNFGNFNSSQYSRIIPE